MRAPGKRCQGRYCFSSLKRFYDQDPETIVKSNRMMINPAEHCPPSEAKYAWKCPRCRGKCDCSTCRKAAGLEPLGRWVGTKDKKSDTPADAGDAESSTSGKAKAKSKAKSSGTSEQAESSNTKVNGAVKGKAKAEPNGESAAAETLKAKAKGVSKGKGKERTLAEAVAASQKKAAKGNGKMKTAIDVDARDDDDISTPPQPDSKQAPKKTLASLLTTSGVRGPVFKPIKPPTEAPPPVFEVIPTKLPEDNMRARMWIYESMVRFDKFGLGRSVLSQLDKFDQWNHSMVQEMLACLLKTIAGLSNLDKGQPTKPFAKAVTAFRNHGKDLQRGEPWSAATEMLAALGLSRTPLPFVEHDIPVEVEAAAAQRSPSPPTARVTRARRAKENNQYEIARQLSLLDSWEEDEFGETGSDAHDDDEDGNAGRSKRRRAPLKKSIYVYDDPSDDESMADPDDSARGRRSGRNRKPAQKEAQPEVRLTGRQQAIKLQQEEEAKQRKEEEQEAARAHEEFRKRRASTASNDDASDASDNEEDAEHRTHTNGRSHKKRRTLTAGDSDDDSDAEMQAKDKDKDEDKNQYHDDLDAKEDTHIEPDEREMESPDLETKVSILSALIDAAVMADSVAEELKTATENIINMERVQRASRTDMEKEIVEELAELNKRAPSIVSPEYQKWKVEKQQLEHDIAWRRQDARVIAELAIDTHALRTGPLGHDVDGREYWHLREYQERMPKFTEGRYAWCLVVLGPAFPADPNAPKESTDEAKDVQQADAGANMAEDEAGKQSQKDEADDSGLTSLDGASDDGKVETDKGDFKLGLPTSLTNGNSSSSKPNSTEGPELSARRICMGANNPMTIKTLIDYVQYRLERVEYEENVSMQEREKQARLGKEDEVSSSSSGCGGKNSPASGATVNGGDGVGVESMYSIRKAKQLLKDTQEERRNQTEQLVKRLNKSKEYFAWHREEIAP